MPNVLITGANRGIGFEFARQYAEDSWNVIATARYPEKAAQLTSLSKKLPRIEILPLEVTQEKSILELAKKLKGRPIDLLINNAGIYPSEGMNMGALDYRTWRETFETNLFGPVRVTEALLENVAASERKQIAAISSAMASLSQLANSRGDIELFYQYRTSKVALNMAFLILSHEVKPRGIGVAIFSPGWVRTDMGGKNARLSPEESVTGMKKVLDGGGANLSGKFWNYDGTILEW